MANQREQLVGFVATKAQHRRLFEVAAARNTTASELMREALAIVIAEHEEKETTAARH